MAHKAGTKSARDVATAERNVLKASYKQRNAHRAYLRYVASRASSPVAFSSRGGVRSPSLDIEISAGDDKRAYEFSFDQIWNGHDVSDLDAWMRHE